MQMTLRREGAPGSRIRCLRACSCLAQTGGVAAVDGSNRGAWRRCCELVVPVG